MKSIMLTTVFFMLSLFVSAQKTPQTPQPPTSVTTSSTSSHYNHNVSGSKTGDSNLSISVSNSNTDYKFSASYSESYDKQVKEILINEFGKESIQKRDSWFSWIFSPGNDEVYSIELSSGKLKMKLDKTQADHQLEEKFTHTGQKIKNLLSGKQEDRNELRLEREAQQLKREAMRMKREADRLNRAEQRQDLDEKRNEVMELRKESERLHKQVDSLQNEIHRLREK
ncbi:hypothetical protein [Mesonia maritima]|uniref:Uncharacterized protein n=1 Tax=Mesonia maritima TaxID=1793873 RepID=A0ABU1K5V7_9FLAO|nr:hypothetical protein [Mesonia maritima]MDR6300990.1 hypothetical protein [Mesonia maritima]